MLVDAGTIHLEQVVGRRTMATSAPERRFRRPRQALANTECALPKRRKFGGPPYASARDLRLGTCPPSQRVDSLNGIELTGFAEGHHVVLSMLVVELAVTLTVVIDELYTVATRSHASSMTTDGDAAAELYRPPVVPPAWKWVSAWWPPCASQRHKSFPRYKTS